MNLNRHQMAALNFLDQRGTRGARLGRLLDRSGASPADVDHLDLVNFVHLDGGRAYISPAGTRWGYSDPINSLLRHLLDCLEQTGRPVTVARVEASGSSRGVIDVATEAGLVEIRDDNVHLTRDGRHAVNP